jgi:hypothetical protein
VSAGTRIFDRQTRFTTHVTNSEYRLVVLAARDLLLRFLGRVVLLGFLASRVQRRFT